MTDRPKRITHALPEARWPTRDEAAQSLLFQPVRLGPALTARTRTWVPAMVPWRATEEGYVTPDILDWYERFAEGRPGVIVVEATGIRDVKSGPLLRISDDRFLPGLRELVERVRRASDGRTRLMIQIIDFLRINRRPPKEKYVRRYLTLRDQHRAALAARDGDATWRDRTDEDVREALLTLDDEVFRNLLDERELEALDFGYRERVTDTHLDHVRELPRVLPDLFAAAAGRAHAAGFDGVELHFAHAYTMSSFLSRLNTRDDGYGGSLEGRVRLPLEVIAACRARVGADYALGCRYLGADAVAGGSTVEDAAWFGVRFAEAGLDFLSVSKGGRFEDAKQPRVGEAAYPYTGPSGHECMPTVRIDERGPFGRNVQDVAAIRAMRCARRGMPHPVIVAGGLCSFRAGRVDPPRSGQADVIGAARQSVAGRSGLVAENARRGSEAQKSAAACSPTTARGSIRSHKQVTCKSVGQGLGDR